MAFYSASVAKRRYPRSSYATTGTAGANASSTRLAAIPVPDNDSGSLLERGDEVRSLRLSRQPSTFVAHVDEDAIRTGANLSRSGQGFH
jgi:hypothetical protein